MYTILFFELLECKTYVLVMRHLAVEELVKSLLLVLILKHCCTLSMSKNFHKNFLAVNPQPKEMEEPLSLLKFFFNISYYICYAPFRLEWNGQLKTYTVKSNIFQKVQTSNKLTSSYSVAKLDFNVRNL